MALSREGKQLHCQLPPAHLPHLFPLLPVLPSQLSHLHLETNHIWSCIHCGCFYCLVQNIDYGYGFQSHNPWKMDVVVSAFRKAPNYFIPLCSLIQALLCAIWLGASSHFIETDAHSEHSHNTTVHNKGSVTSFYSVLGSLGSLGSSQQFSWQGFILTHLKKPSCWNSVYWYTAVSGSAFSLSTTAQGQGNGGCGKLLHLDLQGRFSRMHLFPLVSIT